MSTHVTLIPGDGIGPSISAATTRIIDASGADIEWDTQLAGMAGVARYGDPIPDSTLDSIKRTKLALKGPLETPVGEGYRSINVALRKTFDLYANVRPAYSIVPGGRYRESRSRDDSREHRRVVRRHRALHQDRRRSSRGRRVDGAHHASRVGAHRPLCVRLRGEAQPQEGHARPQGEHSQVLAGTVPGHRANGRARLRRAASSSRSASSTPCR